jgi:hypothetical protein
MDAKKFVTNIIIIIENTLHRELTELEKQLVIKNLYSLQINLGKNLSRESVKKAILSSIQLLNSHYVQRQYDYKNHKLSIINEPGSGNDPYMNIISQNDTVKSTDLIAQLSSSSNSSSVSGEKIHWNFNDIEVKANNIVLDTRYRDISQNNTFRFTFQNVPVSNVQYNGSIYIDSSLKFISQIEIGQFYMSKISTNYIKYFGKLCIYFSEFSSQAINASLNKKYHFAFNITDVGSRYLLTPEKDKFNFDPPINVIESLTFNFLTLDSDFNILPDRDNNATIIYGNPSQVVTSVSHGLSTGDIIYMSGFNSANATLNNTINNIEGNFITKTGDTTFTIQGLDSSSLGVGNSKILVIFGNKRLIIPLILRCVDNI